MTGVRQYDDRDIGCDQFHLRSDLVAWILEERPKETTDALVKFL